MPTCSKCRCTKIPAKEMVQSKGKPTKKCKQCKRQEERNKYYAEHKSTKHTATKLLAHIKNLRSKGWKLQEIADQIGLDISSISYYLSGKRSVGPTAVRKWNKTRGR